MIFQCFASKSKSDIKLLIWITKAGANVLLPLLSLLVALYLILYNTFFIFITMNSLVCYMLAPPLCRWWDPSSPWLRRWSRGWRSCPAWAAGRTCWSSPRSMTGSWDRSQPPIQSDFGRPGDKKVREERRGGLRVWEGGYGIRRYIKSINKWGWKLTLWINSCGMKQANKRKMAEKKKHVWWQLLSSKRRIRTVIERKGSYMSWKGHGWL